MHFVWLSTCEQPNIVILHTVKLDTLFTDQGRYRVQVYLPCTGSAAIFILSYPGDVSAPTLRFVSNFELSNWMQPRKRAQTDCQLVERYDCHSFKQQA